MTSTTTTTTTAAAAAITVIQGQIYRSYPGSDSWCCRLCKIMGDKFDLLEHHCKRNEQNYIQYILYSYGII
ncbi:MAG: hypothetical protein WBF33_26620 [Candidatus Nitrosopolaris sp.]